MKSNREAYEQPQISIKVKNKFINLLFENRQLQQVTYHKTIGCFVVVCLLFLTLSIYFFVDVSKVVEVRQKYYSTVNNTCLMGMNCDVRFSIAQDMRSPVYFMYELGNFYQNHRRYIQSKNNYQLAGNSISSVQAQSCFPYITNADMGNALSWKGHTLNPNDIASPCGSIAFTFFNDTFALYNAAGTAIPINEQGISWEGDKGQKFKRSQITETEQWMDPENEHFIVWMRTSGLPNFKKPWGRIQRDLAAGEYRVTVKNNYNSTEWNGNRYFLLTTLSIIGGRNFILPITFLVIALLSLAAVVFFCRRFRSLRSIAKIKL